MSDSVKTTKHYIKGKKNTGFRENKILENDFCVTLKVYCKDIFTCVEWMPLCYSLF